MFFFIVLGPDHLRGGPSHGYNTSFVKKIKSIGEMVFELCITLALPSGSEGNAITLTALTGVTPPLGLCRQHRGTNLALGGHDLEPR